ncbi:TPA: hypothetical protein LA827_002094 [Clostridium botulinum]|nr:hypothetical protein [Clostridium botulinum]
MGKFDKEITVEIVGEITKEHQKAWAERLVIILQKQYGTEGCKQISAALKEEQ